MMIKGQLHPNWPQVKVELLKVADYIYQKRRISYVGWEVVLTENGISLLEGDSITGVSLH